MTTKDQSLRTVAQNLIENALSNADVSLQLKATILGHIQEQIEASKESKRGATEAPNADNLNVVAIPSLGEFGELLDTVSPRSSNGLFWKQEDLILLKMGKNISVIFYDHAYLKHHQTTSQATEAKEAKEAKETEKKEKTDIEQDQIDNKQNKEKKLRLSKVIFDKQQKNDGMLIDLT